MSDEVDVVMLRLGAKRTKYFDQEASNCTGRLLLPSLSHLMKLHARPLTCTISHTRATTARTGSPNDVAKSQPYIQCNQLCLSGPVSAPKRSAADRLCNSPRRHGFDIRDELLSLLIRIANGYDPSCLSKKTHSPITGMGRGYCIWPDLNWYCNCRPTSRLAVHWSIWTTRMAP